MAVDYSLYLVTDSTKPILGDADLADVVRKALEGGVTIVQYRDKTARTRDLIETARKLHEITKEFAVPLLINDRVDVALAIDAEGIHIGQDDMDLETARKILGPNVIIGVTCSSVEEAHAAASNGADYLGIGTLYATQTKKDTKEIIGPRGTKRILEHLSTMTELPRHVAAVAIGGINKSNIQRILYKSKAPQRALDGVAVVSGIMAATDPASAACELRLLGKSDPSFVIGSPEGRSAHDVESILAKVPKVVGQLAHKGVLSHNMINQVVINFAANVALAIGASPIMSNNGAEADDLASLGGSLLINMGTITDGMLETYLSAAQAYNAQGGPVLLDPVGAGASTLRRQAVQTLMNGGHYNIIKGNESEINVVWGESTVQQQGVDSRETGSTDLEKALLVKKLALRERNIIIMTGRVDFISDGERTLAIRNGTPILGSVTGTGCSLGTTISSFAAIEREDILLGAIAGLLIFEIASEKAAESPNVHGPGTFVPAFIDALAKISRQAKAGDKSWLKAANLEMMDV